MANPRYSDMYEDRSIYSLMYDNREPVNTVQEISNANAEPSAPRAIIYLNDNNSMDYVLNRLIDLIGPEYRYKFNCAKCKAPCDIRANSSSEYIRLHIFKGGCTRCDLKDMNEENFNILESIVKKEYLCPDCSQ
jgi:hypothetical protein